MIRKIVVSAIAIGFLFSGIYANSEEESSETTPVVEEEIEVVGKIEARKALQSVTVVNRKEIEATGHNSLKEILSFTPGLFTISNGTFGQSSSTFIRGSKTTQVLYIIDGVKLRNNSSIGGVNLSTLSSEAIDSVEIVRGPLSSIHGSDAMGGVVNIKTSRSKGLSLKSSYGSHETYTGTLQANGGSGNFYYGTSLDYRRMSDNQPNDVFKSTAITAKTGYKNENIDLGLRFFGDFSKSGIPLNGGVQTLNRNYDQHHFMIAAPITLKFNDKSQLNLIPSVNKASYEFNDIDDTWNPYFESDSTVWEFEAKYFRKIGILNMTAAIDYSTEKIDSENNNGKQIDGKESNYFSGYINTNLDLKALNIFGSLRFDKYKDVESNLSPQIGASWLFNESFKIRASFSMSFKAPMLIQQVNVWGRPNFDLKPEKATSFEIGAEYFSDHLNLSASWFSTRYKDMIGWVTVDPTTFEGQYQNIEKVNASGIEVAATIKPLAPLTFNLTYTYLDTEDKQTEKPLIRRPEHLFTATGIFSAKTFTAAVSVKWVGKRPDVEFQGWDQVDIKNPAYATVDFKLTFPVTDNFSIFGKILNAFDKKYSEIIGYPNPGTRFELGMKVSIK